MAVFLCEDRERGGEIETGIFTINLIIILFGNLVLMLRLLKYDKLILMFAILNKTSISFVVEAELCGIQYCFT